MQKLTKADCGNELKLEDARKIQIEMLDCIVEECRKNNLRYYLSGGTLLGAIRHKGYIPWDDDIDINMPRPDIEALIKRTCGRIGKYLIYGGDAEPYSPGCQWFRLYNPDVIIENFFGGASEKPFYHPIFVDIFPIDGFPKSQMKTNLYCKKLVFIRKMLGVSWHTEIIAKTKLRYIAHAVAWVPAKMIGYTKLRAMFQRNAKKYSFDNSEYVGVTTTVQYLPREKMEKSEYIEPVKVSFEGKEYNAPKNYDYYLKCLYHNYMELPPIEKQKSDHAFKIYNRTEV